MYTRTFSRKKKLSMARFYHVDHHKQLSLCIAYAFLASSCLVPRKISKKPLLTTKPEIRNLHAKTKIRKTERF